jgi:hypothetical protein
MRAISDRMLPEPYRSWIDSSVDIPSGVRLLPRSVDVGYDALICFGFGGLVGGMGVLILVLPPWRFDPAQEGWAPYLWLAAICLGLWSVPALLLRRFVITLRARADERRGALRQGIFVAPEGMLVRMEPNRCHPIAMNRFKEAWVPPPVRPGVRHNPVMIVETLDGPVKFFAERLRASADEVNRVAKEQRRSGKKSGRRG